MVKKINFLEGRFGEIYVGKNVYDIDSRKLLRDYKSLKDYIQELNIRKNRKLEVGFRGSKDFKKNLKKILEEFGLENIYYKDLE